MTKCSSLMSNLLRGFLRLAKQRFWDLCENINVDIFVCSAYQVIIEFSKS